MTRFIPCRGCRGTGYAWFSRGGNDPDTWLMTCEYCHGDGRERCSECQEPVTDAWIEGERVYPLCADHMRAYQEAAAE